MIEISSNHMGIKIKRDFRKHKKIPTYFKNQTRYIIFLCHFIGKIQLMYSISQGLK